MLELLQRMNEELERKFTLMLFERKKVDDIDVLSEYINNERVVRVYYDHEHSHIIVFEVPVQEIEKTLLEKQKFERLAEIRDLPILDFTKWDKFDEKQFFKYLIARNEINRPNTTE